MRESGPASVSPPAPAHGLVRFLPHAIIFLSSACIMIVELVAGRLIARHLGSSLYTWTSIIGVVLAGMSAGNFLGGRLADRVPPRRLLGWLFLASSVACAACLLLNKLAEDWAAAGPLAGASYPARVFISAAFIFLLPALALGTISPVTAKMALARGLAVGGTIGSIYAWGAVGSIVGTFAAGYWLIPALGARGLTLTVALVLSAMGLAAGPARVLHAAWTIALAIALWFSQTADQYLFQQAYGLGLRDGQVVQTEIGQVPRPFLFARDSAYQFVQVYDSGGNSLLPGGRELALDARRHGYVDLNDPTHLEYKYERIYGWLTEEFFRRQPVASAFFLGGGSYTFPRWLLSRWGQARCDVAELDPVVVEADRLHLGLKDDPRIRTTVNDARIVVREMPAEAQYDLIVGDAFSDLSVPWHLTTLEFHRQLKRHMKPDGLLLANIIDNYVKAGGFLGAYIETARKVFKHVHVLTTNSSGPQNWQSNFVVAAFDSDRPDFLDRLQTLLPGHDQGWPASLLTAAHLDYLKARCKGRILTDDDAPVELLLAPAAQ